ncbi:MAG: hypothetical protein LBV63_00295 [Candidatus Methanoplasma sp.]|jgi:hypothetical protein|nr:hypothetical protein [Candidatus Methanoplasma sp.]
MVGTERRTWVALEFVGIIVLLLGVSRYIGIPHNVPDIGVVSLIIIAAGIMLIVESSIFIHLEGVRLENEIDLFDRAKEELENAWAAARTPESIEKDVITVPDDLDEPYLLDFSADPALAALYSDKIADIKEREEEEDIGRIGPGEPIGRLGPGAQTENISHDEPVREEEIERLGPATKKVAPEEEIERLGPADSHEDEWVEEPSNDEFY